MVLHNPNNWHWVDKDVLQWATEWFEKNLTTISAEKDSITAKVSKVVSVDGDVSVSQRKGKVITIYDVKVQVEYLGKTADNEEVGGTITVPEVAHDTTESEYVFDIDIYSDAKSKQPVKDLVRLEIVPKLRKELLKLGPALIAEHGKDIQHTPGSNPSSGFATPTYIPPTSNPDHAKHSSTTSTTTQAGSKGPAVNVTTVTDTEEFQTTAAQLYQTFTDPERLAAFTRAPPRLSGIAKVGDKFELFGGNVSGEYTELDQPKKLVQLWRLKQWPGEHYSELEIKFDQNDRDAVTVMRVNWKGVPIGQEEVTKRNWREYYVRSIKTTFGFGTVL